MTTTLQDLAQKVRSILKASGDKKAAVPSDPGDPDELQPDYRVGDASPTKADAAKVTEDKEGAPEGLEGEDPKGDDTAPVEGEDPKGDQPEEEDEDEPKGDDGQGRPIEKAFDEFGNHDLTDEEVRQVLKAHSAAPSFGPETNPLPQDDLLHEGANLKGVLDDVLNLILHQQEKLENYASVMDDLKAEIARMKKGMGKNEREIAKAFEVINDPKTALAAKPRAINKSLPEPTAPAAPNTGGEALANQIYSDFRAGKIDQNRAMALCREARV